jgi:hypothetical protein
VAIEPDGSAEDAAAESYEQPTNEPSGVSDTDLFDLDAVLAKYVVKPEAAGKPELILLYSPAGSGKTYFAASACELPGVKKVLYLDVEGSTKGTLGSFDKNKIDIIPIYLEEPSRQFPLLNTIVSKLGDKNTVTKYDVVVVDTYDVAQDLSISAFENADGFQTWRDVKEWSLDTARMLKRIAPLGILVMHDREEKVDSGAIVARLRLSGAAKDVLPGIPDMVAYLERKLSKEDGKVHTYAYFESSNKKVTKNRFKFPPIMEDADLPALWAYIDEQAEGKE